MSDRDQPAAYSPSLSCASSPTIDTISSLHREISWVQRTLILLASLVGSEVAFRDVLLMLLALVLHLLGEALTQKFEVRGLTSLFLKLTLQLLHPLLRSLSALLNCLTLIDDVSVGLLCVCECTSSWDGPRL